MGNAVPLFFWGGGGGKTVPANDIRRRGNSDTVAFSQVGFKETQSPW